mmetsp:Transcript_20526/g.26708  ORF Transcript_20526/g.26708 Transcript_20526/m.26708 type:complete len:554 (-) Transcript_20526:154-1815(-)
MADNTSTLFSTDIVNSDVASSIFGQNPGLLVALPGRGWAPYLIVPEGFYALVTTSGAEICNDSGSPVWASGFISAGPFTRISHLVTKAYCVFNVPVKGCKTADNVTVTIDCSIVFRIMGDVTKNEDPELVRTFVHDCTPAGLEQQLKDAMAEEIRTLARSMKHTEVYTARKERRPTTAIPTTTSNQEKNNDDKGSDYYTDEKDGIRKRKNQKHQKNYKFANDDNEEEIGFEMSPSLSSRPSIEAPPAEVRSFTTEEQEAAVGADVTMAMEDRLNAQFNPQGVEIHDIIIQNIRLPKNIEIGMSNKTLVRSKQEYEVMEQTFEMQSIRLQNDEDKIKLEYKEDEELAKVQGQRDVQASQDALRVRKAERDKELADYKEGTVIAEKKIKSQLVEETTKLQFEYQQVLQTLKLEAAESATNIKADALATIDELNAETKYQIAQLEGESKSIMANAEKDSDEYLIKKRQFELRDKYLKVYDSFATNPDVIISTSKETEFNMLMLSDNALDSIHQEGGFDEGKDKEEFVRNELDRLRLAGSAYGLKTDTFIPSKMADI